MNALRTCLLLALSGITPTAFAAAGPILSTASVTLLRDLQPGQRAELTGFPIDTAQTASVEFERIDIYSPEARLIEVTPLGRREVPRSRLVLLIGHARDGGADIGMSIDPDTLAIDATVRATGGNFSVNGVRGGGGVVLKTQVLAEFDDAGLPLDFRCAQSDLPKTPASPLSMATADAPTPNGSVALRQTVVAVDTDGEWMSQSTINDNSTNASNWIASLFLQMNVLYERDINLRLLQGTTFFNLDPATDPYTVTGSGASSAQLNEFGNYWAANHSRVYRHFAMLLSGKSSSNNSASGIAWIDAYCKKPSSGGSYSFSQTFKFAGNTGAQNAALIAHELGHNFGSPHTHCDDGNTANGVAPLDQCYNGEAGCFSGATVCPGGADGSKGTLMSYCHIGACGGTNNYKLDYSSQPTNPVAARMNSRISANFASCIDVIFKDGNQP